jgi:DNA-binding winged helix-turn-helix (wHTH) protein
MATGDTPLLRFGPFTLDRLDGRLAHDGRSTELKPKALGLLLALIDNAGRLVSKEELLDSVWGTRFITEGVIKTQMAELRSVLGDDPKAPRWIETVHGRGYRFAGRLDTTPGAPAAAAPAEAPHRTAESPLVGRRDELAVLQQGLAQARLRQRQLFGVAGDPGVGKSTLLAAFVASLEGARVASGQCVERWGGSEPYLPVLDALDQLCAAEPALVATVRDVAPMWLGQMPWHLPDGERAALQAQITGAAPERMLREFGALLERLSAERPLVWLLEDVHWADPATVHLIASLARRRAPAALMVVLSFRPIDLAFSEHPFGDLRRELRQHRLMHELSLDGLSEDDVGQLVRRRHGEACAEPDFVQHLHRYTEGLPLFVQGVLDELVDNGVIVPGHGGAGSTLQPDAALRLAVPQTLADMFNRQLQSLPAEVNVLLETAALAGQEFDHLTLADAAQLPPDQVREHLEALVRRRIWLQPAGVAQLPGGRIAARCSFRHALIRHLLAARSGSLARIERHRRLAAALERQWGATPELALELALHHEEGRQPAEAARHLAVAGLTALQRLAPREALALADRGLALLAAGGPRAELDRLPLLSVRLTATLQLEGMASPVARAQVGEVLARLDTLPASPDTVPLWQVALLIHFTGRLEGTTALVQRFAALAGALPASAGAIGRAVACNALGIDALHRGHLVESVGQFEQTLQMLDSPVAAALMLRDPRSEAWSYLCLAAEVLGRQPLARACSAEVDAMIGRGADLITIGMGRWFQVYAQYFRADAKQAHTLAGDCVALLESSRASPFLQPHRIGLGWARAALGQLEEGAALAADGLQRYLEQGSRQGLAGLHAVVAETFRLAGQTEAVSRYAAAGLASAEDRGDGFALSELHRLQGLATPDAAAAEASLRQALALAREQQASLLEARAALSLSQWLARSGREGESRALAEEIAAGLPAGLDAPVVLALRG